MPNSSTCGSPSRPARNPSSWSPPARKAAWQACSNVDQAKTLVASAQANAALLEKAQEQTENLINFLLGRHPGPVARGKSLVDQPQPPQVPAGLPSALLERRPDLRVAEQQLIAANARVGVAKAAFYPSINLTAAGGFQTTDLLGVVSRTGFGYSMGGVVDLPIFDAGRRSGELQDREGAARRAADQLSESHQWSLPRRFRRAGRLPEDQGVHQQPDEPLAETLRDQSRLANVRYVGGVSSYLEVLDTERQRLTAEQQLAQAQRDVLTSLVQLYKALGGGWQ